MKTKIICVMGKSGSGKSTLINETVKLFDNFYAVKSYTTRKPRENDPEDIKTHKFVLKECLNKDEENKQVVSLYHSDKGYYSWTTHSCFKENKINLYAIDPIACIEFIEKYSDMYDIYTVYLSIDDKERLLRLKIRDGITKLPEEEHLSIKHLKPLIANDKYKPSIFSVDNDRVYSLQKFVASIIGKIIKRHIY